MSWDVLFQDLPNNAKQLSDIDESYVPSSLCKRSYYEKMILELFPNANQTDKSWIILDNQDYSIEFSSGSDDPMESLMLHIRGNEKALEVVNKIHDYTNWKAIDCSMGDLIDFDNNPDEGFRKWREFRDIAINSNTNSPSTHVIKKWWEFWK
jgi:hypothetical protein